MLLSIGMIVKNEEKYLEMCLTALKPFLDSVDSELIIADTGSTDNTFEIAKKFTDNVFHFEWINDFAAARNSTLDKAKGEWYMFIDADEVVRDCTPLIDFFNSGEYKKYGSATFSIRNYNDLSRMDLYNSYDLHRLTALVNGVRFTKPIHEQFDQYFGPVKKLDLIADHYGYVFRDNGKVINDFLEMKTSRNLDLLFQELEEEKKTGQVKETVYGQIADCYILNGDNDRALEYIELGLDNCSPESYVRIEYLNKKVKILGAQGKQDEIIELCKQYFSKDNLARKEKLVTDSNFYFAWAIANFNFKNYNDVVNKAVLGFDIYRSYRNGKLYTPELNFCGIETTIPGLKQLFSIFVVACSHLNRYDIAAREVELIPLDDLLSDEQFMKTYLSVRTELMEHINYNKLSDLYYQLDKPNRALFINILIRNIFRTEKHEHFLKKLATIATDDERLADMVEIYNSHFVNHSLNPRKITKFIEKHGTKDNEPALLLMLMKNYDIAPFVCAEDFDAEKCVTDVFGDFMYLHLAAEPFGKYMTDRISENGIEKAAEVFYRVALSATEKRLDTTKLILNYGKIGKRWKELNPDKEVPENISFALTIGEIAELNRKKHYEESTERLTELIGNEDPSLDNDNTKILRHYFLIVQDAEKKNKEMMEKHNENPMMVALAEQIKQEIRVMIDNWDLNGAEDALNQMAKMAPFDPDIEDIRDEINDRKVNYMKYM